MTNLSKETILAWKNAIDLLLPEELFFVWYSAPNDWEVFRNYELWLYFVFKIVKP